MVKRNPHTWDRWSSVYDWVTRRNPLFERPRRREFHLAGIQPSDRILVIGVGTGLDLVHLPVGANVAGIDVSAAMLARAQAKAESRNCALYQMSADRLRFDDCSFDVVIMNCVLSIVGDPQQALREAARVLSPAGNIWIMGKFCETPPGAVRRGLSRVTTRMGGVDLTGSLTEAIDGTALRVAHHAPTPAADVIRLNSVLDQISRQHRCPFVR